MTEQLELLVQRLEGERRRRRARMEMALEPFLPVGIQRAREVQAEMIARWGIGPVIDIPRSYAPLVKVGWA